VPTFKCGILAYGFARAHGAERAHDFLLAFSGKGRAVCPSCNTRRMAETAAHLLDPVLPPLPVRQWVFSLPKRLRDYLKHDREARNCALFSNQASDEQGLLVKSAKQYPSRLDRQCKKRGSNASCATETVFCRFGMRS
jgi:hypothetical protein